MSPKCEINFNRRFSLPFGIAPGELLPDDLGIYLKSLDIGAELLNDTFTVPLPSTALKSTLVKKITSPDNVDYVIPADSTFDTSNAFTSNLNLTNAQANAVKRSAAPIKINSINSPDIAKELMKKVVFNNNKNSLCAIPVPYHYFDTIRCFWTKESSSPLADTLKLNFKGDTNPYFLETYKDNSNFIIGELDRTNIRSPLTGLVRFEPYYHFKISSSGLEVLCPSNAGRLIINGPEDSNKSNSSETRLFENTEFIIDNVERLSAIIKLTKLLLYTTENFQKFASKSKDKTLKTKLDNVEDKFEIDCSSFLYDKYKALTSKVSKAWLLFKKNINSIKTDTLTWADIQTGFTDYKLFEGAGTTLNAEVLFTLLNTIYSTPAWKNSFTDFLSNYYVHLSCGISWYEVRALFTNDNNLIKFPVAASEDPKNKTDKDSKTRQVEHAWLESIYDDNKYANAFLCYSGFPIANGSKVYRKSALANPGKTTLPTDALTIYELESVHLAGRSADVFPGLTVNEARDPQPGKCLSLTDYNSKIIGSTASFQICKSYYYLITDWFQELLKETNGLKTEDPVIDILGYYNQSDNEKTHPLLTDILQFTNYKLGESIRDQMDVLEGTNVNGRVATIPEATLLWWINQASFITDKSLTGTWPDGSPAAPINQFKSRETHHPAYNQFVTFENGISNHNDSGCDLFDLESIFLARNAVYNYLTTTFDIPLPVILALLNREGVFIFSWLSRNTVPKYWWRWKAHKTFVITNNTNQHDFARTYFLAYPYGLDSYVVPIGSSTSAATNGRLDKVINDLLNNNVLNSTKISNAQSFRQYITERVYAPSTDSDGIPYIQKWSKRSHWTYIILMLAWYQYRHKLMKEKGTVDGSSFNYTDSAWFDNDFSNVQGTINSLDTRRKDFITYYSMLYLGYNADPSIWSSFIRSTEAASRGTLGLRDYLLFRFKPSNISNNYTAMCNMLHFAATLDGYCRLICDKTNVTIYDDTDPNNRNWGI